MFEKHKIKKILAIVNDSIDQEEYSKACRELIEFGEEGVALIAKSIMNNEIKNDKIKELLSTVYRMEHLAYFVYLLSSPNGHVRQASKLTLRENLKEIDALNLFEGLTDTPFYVRKNLTDLIIEKNDPKVAIPSMELYKKTKDDALKKNLFSIFDKFPCTELKDFLLKLTERCSYSERNTVITLLKAYNDPKVIEFLENLLNEKDTKILRNVVESLGMLKAKKVARRLVPMLDHKDLLLRQKAVEALQRLVNPSVVPELMHLFKSTNVNTRRAVVEVLNALHDEESITVLIKALGDDDWWVREIATQALSHNGNKMIPDMLQKLLHVKNVCVRHCAVNFFTHVPGTFVLKDLVILLDDEELEIRLKAMEALSLLKDDRAVPYILKKAGDVKMQLEIPLCLGQFESETANKAISKLLQMKDNEMILVCLRVINKFKIIDSLPALQEMVEDAQFEVRQQITNTIRFLSGTEKQSWRG